MNSRRLYAHFTESVRALQFLNIPNPSIVYSYTDLTQYGSSNMFWLDTAHQKHFDEYSLEANVLTAFLTKSGNLDFNWNTIVARSSDTPNQESYLSITYWENVVLADEPFEILRLIYSSTYTVEPSMDITSVEVEYLNHDVDEGTAIGGSGNQVWRTHKNMYRTVESSSGDVLFPKISWVLPGTSIPVEVNNSAQDRKITAWNGDAGDYSVSFKFVDSSSGVPTVEKAEYRGIPSCSVQGCKLMVSPKFGVEFYDTVNGRIYNQTSIIGAPIFSDSRDFKVYRFEGNVILFYFPDSYEAWISCKLGTVTDGYDNWQTPWRVGDSNLKVVVPSYFSLIPFVFMQNENSEWRISYALKLCDDSSEMFARYNSTSINTKESLITDTEDIQVYQNDVNKLLASVRHLAIPVEIFFSSEKYLYPYMQNIIMGYPSLNKGYIADYFFAQLYLSYHTFIQALRSDEFYGANPQMCDCGIKVGKFFIPYSQDFIVEGFNSPKKTSFAIEVSEGFEVDNMLAYSNEYLISLYSGDSVSTSNVTNVQMRNGIIVGWDGSKYVQLQ